MPLSKPATHNRGREGKSERPCWSGDGRQAEKRERDERKGGKRSKRASCAWGALLRVVFVA